MIEFRHTLLPVPVRPAISRWGHARHVDDHRVARHVLAEEDRNLHRAALRLRLLDHLAKPDHLPGGVGHLDPDRVFAGDRGHDPDARYAEGDCEVVGEVCDLGQPEARLELDLVLRDHRAGLDLDHLHLEAELGEGLFQHFGPVADLLLLLVELEVFRRQEQVEAGQLVVAVGLGGELERGGRRAAGGPRADRHRGLRGLARLRVVLFGRGIGLGNVIRPGIVELRANRLPPPDADRGAALLVNDVILVVRCGLSDATGEPVSQARKDPREIDGVVVVGVGCRGRAASEPVADARDEGRQAGSQGGRRGDEPREQTVDGQVEAAEQHGRQQNRGAGSSEVGLRQKPTDFADPAPRAPERPRHGVGQKDCQQGARCRHRDRSPGSPQGQVRQ
jgi:hypothetical protein